MDQGPPEVGSDAGADFGEADLGLDAGAQDIGFPDQGILDQGVDAGPPAGSVNLSFSGCQLDFSGDIVVSYNGSLGVAALQGGLLTASVQFDLGDQRGMIPLSTQHRVDTGLVVNLFAQTTWTNIAQDPGVLSGGVPDPIQGALFVQTWEPAQGRAEVEFLNVTLQNASTNGLCTINGTVHSDRLGR